MTDGFCFRCRNEAFFGLRPSGHACGVMDKHLVAEAFVLGSCDRFSSCSPVLCLSRRVQDLVLVPRSCRQRHWYAWAGFAVVDALRAMLPSFVSVYSALRGRQWYTLCAQDTFCGPLYLTVTCTVFGVRLWSTRLRIFLEITSGIIYVFSTLWFDSGYMSVSVYVAFG